MTDPQHFQTNLDRFHERQTMVAAQIAARGVTDARVLAAMRRVPRHAFIPAAQAPAAYADRALPIGYGLTISQPYIVALMTEHLHVNPGDRVLEIGTGSGYQAAVLAEMGAQVFSLEIVTPLAERAADTLESLGYGQAVTVIPGDGYEGYPPAAPYDRVMITCAVPVVPLPVISQVRAQGRLILPLGDPGEVQRLIVATKMPAGHLKTEDLIDVVFVPLTGPHGEAGSEP